MYIYKESNNFRLRPQHIYRSMQEQLSTDSANEKVFNEAKTIYQQDLTENSRYSSLSSHIVKDNKNNFLKM